ncbi:MAG: YopX family protein [Melioribacteraceae bacterium]|jgi:uncharacterized phage protein (TIGR01671 family)|nr:YopX family protein [Melioribacteraceae bacterium]
MREIKFSARRITGEWIYGSLIIFGQRTFIYPPNGSQEDYHFYGYEVLPKTVVQFTGLNDKNGMSIYEGHILSEKWKCEVYQNDEGTFMVKFHTNPDWNSPMSLKKYLYDREIAGTSDRDNIIIGNIHENPELLNQ